MHPFKLLVIVCVGFWVISASASEKPDWQTALEEELQRATTLEGILPDTIVQRNRLYITVSARTGQILDSHSKAELLPFLTALQKTYVQESVRYVFLEEWIEIAESGVRGTPSVIDYPLPLKSDPRSVYSYIVH